METDNHPAMRHFLVSIAILSLFVLTACDAFVRGVDEPNDAAPTGDFTSASDVEFLLTGVQANFARSHTDLTLSADLLSDQIRFGNNGDATGPSFVQLDSGVPQVDDNRLDFLFSELSEYRLLADDLVRVINQSATFGEDPPITREEALFGAHLHRGIARYYLATYFGLNPREGGGVINRSGFIPSPAMYDSARVKFGKAREFTSSTRDTEVLASIEARSALFAGTQFGSEAGGYEEGALRAAASLAGQGLERGDDLFNALYSVQQENEWWDDAGRGRVIIVAQDDTLDGRVQPSGRDGSHKNPEALRSFIEIVRNNSAEAARIPLVGVTPDANFVDISSDDAIEFAQDKYPSEEAPIPFITWQENHLMRAELELRGFSTGEKDALTLVNEVRESFGLSALSSVNMETVAQERDRTLFAQGVRLVDQRRLDVVEWHLVETFEGTTTWQYFPIPESERNRNPNL